MSDLAARIRALELELGLREWDDQDESDATYRASANVRYMSIDSLVEFIASERERLTRFAGPR